ncbi:MAG: von Willebrand factor type A domain-containing protein [Saprospiraceae bacterium]|nr:von Willebrand factor type A domain-containing protein [Saprospiraceae bacterium]
MKIQKIIQTILFMVIATLPLHTINAQTAGSLKGTVTDGTTGEVVPLASVMLFQDGVFVTGIEADLDGNYYFSNIPAGTYDIEIYYVGLQTNRYEGVPVRVGRLEYVDLVFLAPRNPFDSKTMLEEIRVTAYKIPIIEQSQMGSGQTLGAEDIDRMTTRSIRSVQATSAGVNQYDEGEPINSGGRRSSSSDVYVDGVRITGNFAIPENEIGKIKLKKGWKKQIGKQRNAKKMEEEGPLPKMPTTNKLENPYYTTNKHPFSTFSIDVDQASYTRVEASLNRDRLPNKERIRLEEMINYFDYDYAAPAQNDPHPFAVHTELATCPWNENAHLLQIGVQGRRKQLKTTQQKNNLVFLIDVSGSMHSSVELLKESLKLMLDGLDEEDRVAIVVYAGAAGLVLPSTAVKDKGTILKSLDNLSSGGSTNGGAGIHLAYKVAQENFDKKGNNRIVLVTDGDFNVGTSSHEDLEKLIEEKRKTNVFLTVLGMGASSYGDQIMETLANKGNGVYMQVNNQADANKVVAEELAGSLYTIAKDVKLQLEFDKEMVASYRLIGYVNRVLKKEDFDDDTKDAGELGLGHNVTALYELKFHKGVDQDKAIAQFNLRYKKPDADKSQLIEHKIYNQKEIPTIQNASQNMQFASSVAAWAMLMMNSKYVDTKLFDYKEMIKLAENAKGNDEKGYRTKCIELMKKSQKLTKDLP